MVHLLSLPRAAAAVTLGISSSLAGATAAMTMTPDRVLLIIRMARRAVSYRQIAARDVGAMRDRFKVTRFDAPRMPTEMVDLTSPGDGALGVHVREAMSVVQCAADSALPVSVRMPCPAPFPAVPAGPDAQPEPRASGDDLPPVATGHLSNLPALAGSASS